MPCFWTNRNELCCATGFYVPRKLTIRGGQQELFFAAVSEFFKPYRDKRDEYLQRPDTVRDMLQYGAKKARAIGSEYLMKARRNVGVDY